MTIKRASQNKYTVYDDEGLRLGGCTIARRVVDRIFPDVPVQYVITVSGAPAARDILYGAAVGRAQMLASKEEKACRIYAEVDPKDADTLDMLSGLGFGGNDGIRRMTRPVEGANKELSDPEGSVLVTDRLEDGAERQKCLKRYNECFGTQNTEEWLDELASNEDFARLLLINDSGLMGEALIWSAGNVGIVGIIQVSRPWRRQNVASCLIEHAREYFEARGIQEMSMDVWLSSPGCAKLAKKAGFRGNTPLILYPELMH